MSVALEFAPTVSIPARARPETDCPDRRPLATVTVLAPPREVAAPATVRLTRRGVVVLTLAVAVLGLGLVWLARASAPQAAPPAPAPHTVTVQPGDTLWSIAARVAPQRDPRAEVDALQHRNALTSVDLVPGQLLRVP